MQDLNVSRISRDFQNRNFCSLSKTGKDVIRSMDFENISFEQTREDPVLPNLFCDLQSARKESPIQKSSQDHQQELEKLLCSRSGVLSKRRDSQRPKPGFSCLLSPEMSKSMAPGVGILSNPFKDLSFTSENQFVDRTQGSLKWPHFGSKSQNKNLIQDLPMNKSSIRKNCFYETDEESEKETAFASKITCSPSLPKYHKSKTQTSFLRNLKKMRSNIKEVIPEMKDVLSKQGSFLTLNKSTKSFGNEEKRFEGFPFSRAKTKKSFEKNHRSRSQRSLLSLNIGRNQSPLKVESVPQQFGAFSKNNSCFIERRHKSPTSSFLLNKSKFSNFLDNFVFPEQKHLYSSSNKFSNKRNFSPSQHSIKKKQFWPSHLEDRFLALNSSFLSGLEPFVSSLSFNIKKKKKCEQKKLSIGNKIIKLNRKIKEKLLKRKNEFNPEEGKKLIELFSQLLENKNEDTRRYKQNDFLKKVKQN